MQFNSIKIELIWCIWILANLQFLWIW